MTHAIQPVQPGEERIRRPAGSVTTFVKLHRTARMPARACSAGPVRLAPAPRAVADTAWLLTDLRDVRAVVAEAVQVGRCTIGAAMGSAGAGGGGGAGGGPFG